MAQPTLNMVHPVDPVLTGLLVGYMQADTRFIASRVFPVLQADEVSGTYFTFTKKYWFSDEMKKRAPGGSFVRAGFGVETASYKTEQWGLENPIPQEIESASQIPMSLQEAGTRWLAIQSLIRKERQFAADFMTTGVWGTDNTTATNWSDFSAGDPVADMLAAKKAISDATGFEPNTLALGLIVHNALINHPDVIDRVKYTVQATQGNIERALAALLGVSNYFVGRASYNLNNEGQSFSGSPVIDDDALLCYVESTPNKLLPSAGYTLAWEPGGGIGQVSQYWDQRVRSTILQHVEQWDQKVVASDVGYFFSGIV